MKKLTAKEKLAFKKFGKNLLKFTAPFMAVFFYQLSMGVEMKVAGPLALVTFWGVVADYFKKLK